VGKELALSESSVLSLNIRMNTTGGRLLTPIAEFSVDLQNITNAQNVLLQRYQPRTNSIATEFQQGFFPVPTFRWTW